MASSSFFRLISKTSRFWNCRREIMTSASSRLSSSPWLILPPPSNDGEKVDMNFYSLEHNKVGRIKGGFDFGVDHTKLVGSSHGWLAFTNSRHDLFLWNPVSRRRMDLPPTRYIYPLSSDIKFGSPWFRKVIVCSGAGGEGEGMVVISYGREWNLALWRQSYGEFWNNHIGGYEWYRYEDFAYSAKQNRLFCIAQNGDLYRRIPDDYFSIDGSNADQEKIVARTAKAAKYVVVAEHSHEVFVVARNITHDLNLNVDESKSEPPPPSCYFYNLQLQQYYGVSHPYKTVSFDVFKVHDDGAGNLRLRPSASLDGLVLFIGINHSFALPAAQFPELQSDSIYFTDDMEFLEDPPLLQDDSIDDVKVLEGRRCRFGGHDVGIYDYQNKTFSSCYYPNDARAIARISPSPFWFTPIIS